jgi:hypothetical protein
MIHLLQTKDKGPKFHSLGNAYKDNRDMNLVNMIFNIESNNSNDYKKPLDVYEIYENMKELNLTEGFKNSLKNSKNCVKIPPLTRTHLTNLKKNDLNSFLALPVLGKGHLWSILIRKTEEGFSGMMINKGLRFWHDPVEEFIFKEENKGKLVEVLKYCGAFKMHSVEDVYRKFIQNSDKQYHMSIHASPQKVGNCFTKNIQAAIKFAYATRTWDANRVKSFRVDKAYTSFGTDSQDKLRLKWGIMETEKMQKLFVKNIVEKNENIENTAKESEGIYVANKTFRKRCKDFVNLEKNFLEVFDPKLETVNFFKSERLKMLIKKITPYTYEENRQEVDKLVLATQDQDYIGIYKKLKEFTALTKNNMGNLYFHLFMEAKHDIGKSLERIFDKDGKYHNLSYQEKSKILLEKLEPHILILHHGKIKSFLKTLYHKDHVEAEFGDLYESSKSRLEKVNNKMPSRKEKKELEKHFPIILGQVNHRISEYYNTIKEAHLENRQKTNQSFKDVKKSSELDKQEMLEDFMIIVNSKVDREIEDLVGFLDERLNELDHKMDILVTKIPNTQDERLKEFQRLRGEMFRGFSEMGKDLYQNYATLETETIKYLKKEDNKGKDYEERLSKRVMDFDHRCQDFNQLYSKKIDTLALAVNVKMENIFEKKNPTQIIKIEQSRAKEGIKIYI